MPLSEIHTSGDVPQFKEKLERGMMNLFRRMRPEAPVLRNNNFLQVDHDLRSERQSLRRCATWTDTGVK